MDMLQNLWGIIKANFFYDFRSSIMSICFLLGIFYLNKLLKDNGEKIFKSFKYIVCVAMFFSVILIFY